MIIDQCQQKGNGTSPEHCYEINKLFAILIKLLNYNNYECDPI